MQQLQLSTGHVAIIDAESLDREFEVEIHSRVFWRGKLSDVTWRGVDKGHTVYAVATVASRFELRLHRVVMNARVGEVIDHEDGDGLHNLRGNLRSAGHTGNARNRRPSAGKRFKGVSRRSDGTFEAYIKANGKKKHLGLHQTEEAAALAYDAAARIEFGEHACLNLSRCTGCERPPADCDCRKGARR